MKKIILFNLLMLLTSLSGWCQEYSVKGKVKSESGEKLPGVNVIIKGTSTGTVTDFEGNYNLKVNDGLGTLIFSFIGYEPKEVPIRQKKKIDVTLKSNVTELDEIIAVGYGTVRKKDLTGSVASVDIGELEKVPNPNLAQALSGRISGVMISTSEGSPDASISIRVRGGGSITQSNEPLYIVDGFPTEDGLDNLDPSDIESIDVLKDASSTAIYGARGANGVILVTTKGGQEGKTTVNYDGYYGFKQVVNRLDVLNPFDFVKLDYERSINDDALEGFVNRYGTWDELEELYKDRSGVNWQDEMFGKTVVNQTHKISISGGTKKTKYNVAYSFNDDEGIMLNSGAKKSNAKFKFDHKVSDKLKATVNINYSERETFGMGTSDGGEGFNKLQHVLNYRPTIGKNGNDRDLVELDEDPLLEDSSGNVMQNPIVSTKAEHRLNETSNLALNGMLDYEIIKGLHYRLTVGMVRQGVRKENYNGLRSVSSKRAGSASGSLRRTDKKGYSYSNVLNYTKTFNKIHRVNALIGQEEVYSETKWFEASTSGFASDDIALADLSLGSLPGIPGSGEEDNLLLSWFGRVNYTLNDKYLATFSYRADGSSKFGSGNKYGYFPSASLAWRLGEEPFIKQLNAFSNFKVRLSYGEAGNNRIPNYQSLAILSSGYYPLNNVSETSVAPTVLPNPDLKWETTVSQNLGFDIGFFNQKFQLTVDIYKANTKDLLLKAQVPMTSGYATMLRNVGETQNKGLELSVSSMNINKKKFKWQTDFNISFNKNKVVKLAYQDFFLRESGWFGELGNDYIVQVGKPVGQIYGYEYEGMYQVEDFDYDAETNTYNIKEGVAYKANEKPKPGFMKLRDISGPDGVPDGKITDADRTIIGDTNPVHFGGITNSFTYGNFDFSIFMNWSYGNDVYNANKMRCTLMHRSNKNTLGVARERWTTIDENGAIFTDPELLAAANVGKKFPVFDGMGRIEPKLSSLMIEDGSYLRISNISLGYNVPRKLLKRVGISKLRLYSTVYNIHTFTNYSGYDPDVSTRNSGGVTPGVDWGAYPRSRSYILGLSLSL
ncbi:TonB-dependent receptor [Puteibacter caeruleilacunae]|nr:TonB-dependent receptor [Puteibacter caeruleilacunae]